MPDVNKGKTLKGMGFSGAPTITILPERGFKRVMYSASGMFSSLTVTTKHKRNKYIT